MRLGLPPYSSLLCNPTNNGLSRCEPQARVRALMADCSFFLRLSYLCTMYSYVRYIIKATHPRQFRSNNLDVGNSWEQNVNFSSVSKHVRTTCKCTVGISNNYKPHFATHNTKSILPLMNDTTLLSAHVPLTPIHRSFHPPMAQRPPIN